MNAVDVLTACRDHGREKTRLEERLEEMEEAMTGLASGVGLAVQAAPGDRFAAYAARRDDIERRLKRLGRLLAAEGQAVILLSDSLPDVQRKSLRDFYVRCSSVSKIAAAYGYTPSNIYKAMAEGRRALREIPEDRVAEKLPGWYVKEWEEAEA